MPVAPTPAGRASEPNGAPLPLLPTARLMRRYLVALAGGMVLVMIGLAGIVALLSRDGGVEHDFLGQVAKAGDADWYRDVGGRSVNQIQDQDIFYSNVGHSIAAAKASDIVLLGPSFVARGIDRPTLRSSALLGGLKTYNMAFLGIRGGEFSRRIIARWRIRPALWLINADDQFVHFFSDDLHLTIGSDKKPIDAAARSRLQGHLTVLRRNVRWRIEDWIAVLQGRSAPDALFGDYRSVSTGDMMNTNPAYAATGNPPMRILRDRQCDTSPAVVDHARRLLREIGGQIVLMLVPHSQACARQAAELAKALNVEFIPPPDDDALTTLDGGGHLDRNGAARFTRYLAAELIKTKAFAAAFGGRLGLASRREDSTTTSETRQAE